MKEDDNPITLANVKAAKADLERRIAKLINTFEEDYGVKVSCNISRDYNKSNANITVSSVITID